MSLNDCYCHLGLTFSQNDLLKKFGGGGGGYAFRFHWCGMETEAGIGTPGVTLSCSSPADQSEAAVSRRRDRRLPLSDSNLWSISIIGGVCRDSYSNNYLDQTVSKATTPPPTAQRTNSERLCLPARLVIEKESLTPSLEPSFVKNRLVKITESCLYSAVIPLSTNKAAASVFISVSPLQCVACNPWRINPCFISVNELTEKETHGYI